MVMSSSDCATMQNDLQQRPQQRRSRPLPPGPLPKQRAVMPMGHALPPRQVATYGSVPVNTGTLSQSYGVPTRNEALRNMIPGNNAAVAASAAFMVGAVMYGNRRQQGSCHDGAQGGGGGHGG